jgi:hypothetical protein
MNHSKCGKNKSKRGININQINQPINPSLKRSINQRITPNARSTNKSDSHSIINAANHVRIHRHAATTAIDGMQIAASRSLMRRAENEARHILQNIVYAWTRG